MKGHTMIDTYNFNLTPACAVLGPISGNDNRHPQRTGAWGKPMFASHAHGWLVINLSHELEKALGRTTLQRTKSAPVLLCAHFETEQAVYQLHVATRVQLSLLEQSLEQVIPSRQGATPC
ncbi:hypothetical protein CKO18_15760 [Rhodoferax fermentans]|uniref:Uncharacterized protein n=2 Tax=Rhodoferax fermentans TaxID=28066 RepID=A0A1T1ATI6_RHOFE|nr:hypothetical protein [Rhodoferax fermentans]OOV07426.1 hypothetical protein RF819_12425 [Rhodoferax fermentans]